MNLLFFFEIDAEEGETLLDMFVAWSYDVRYEVYPTMDSWELCGEEG